MNRQCGTTPCPKCGVDCPCDDHVEVDVGVGVVTGEHEWLCPEHGLFAFATGGVVFRDEKT